MTMTFTERPSSRQRCERAKARGRGYASSTGGSTRCCGNSIIW